MGQKIKIAGLDGSKRNFGIAIMELDLDTLELTVAGLELIKTEKDKNKQVRKSSDNLRACQELAAGIMSATASCTAAFFEVPSGGQSADACMSFGMVIGLYGMIEPVLGIPTIEVSPSETKLAAVGTRTASKQEMIEWAAEKFPDAPWRRYERNGKNFKKGEPMLDNEHLADAVAIVYAGIKTPAFKTTLAMLRASMPKAA